MKRVSRYIAVVISAALAAAAALSTSCKATDTVAETQTNNILSYLGSLPRSEGFDPLTLGDSLYMVTDGIYKYISARSEDPQAPLVKRGDRMTFSFDIRQFTNRPADYPIYSNRIDMIEQYGTPDWPAGDIIITVGSGAIIGSIDNALPDCRVGSEVTFIIPSGRLFDDEGAGVLPANSTLMYKILITGINPE